MSTNFCIECNNLLYPREDKATRTLLYGCRNCDHTEEATESTRVFQHIVQHSGIDKAAATVDLSSDPTYPRIKKDCPGPGCESQEAVFFQSRAKRADTSMKLYFACVKCFTRWSS